MPEIVIRKDGRKEPLIREKIVISAVKTGALVKVTQDIAGKIEKHSKDEVETGWIRKHVFNELKLYNPDWPKYWLSFDEGVKRLYKHRC